MIVVEGPDGSGKSTLVAALENKFGIVSKHFGGPPADMQEIQERVMSSLNEPLLDRWSPISEQVYAPIRGQHRSMDILDTFVNKYRPFVIYCRPPKIDLMRNKERCLEVSKEHKSARHCEMVSTNFRKVVDLYDQVMKKLVREKVDVFAFDYTEPGEFELLLKHIEKRELL